MELRELRAFVAVVEEGGLSAAARRLHLSQPALSQTMNQLERQFGLDLLVRSSSGVQPTEAGRTLLTEARAVLARHDQAVAAVQRHASPNGNVLRIGIPLELPPDLLNHPLAELARAHPDTRVEPRHLSTSAQFEALQAGELDLGLVRERPTGPDLDAIQVAATKLGVLLARDLAAAVATDGCIRLDKLAGLDWIGFHRSHSPAWYDEIVATLRSHGITLGPDSPAEQRLLPAVKLAAVSSGGAFAFAPTDWSEPIPESITWLPLAGSPLVRRTWAVWPAASRRKDLGTLIVAFDSAV